MVENRCYGGSQEDILLLKCLLEATRKLERQFQSRSINFHGVVFIRNDIYQHLVLDPADRGKDTPVQLDWNDAEVFKEILRRRILLSTGLEGTFVTIWPLFFETHIKGEESFSYILGRTLMRPREVLRCMRGCIEVAINRGHEASSKQMSNKRSEHFRKNPSLITLELKDVNPKFSDVPYASSERPEILSRVDIETALRMWSCSTDFERVLDLLLWFGSRNIRVG